MADDPLLATKITRKTAAALLNLSPMRIDQLVADGVLKRENSRFILQELLNDYIAFVKKEHRQNNTGSAVANRAQQARAAEIEARMARESRKVIELAEASQVFDEVTGEYLLSLGSLPARITRDARERQRIEAICDAERLRLSDHYAEKGQALRSGVELTEADTEDDA